MDLRLGQAGVMLRTFLEDELSETHLGLSSAARAHLERFRSFLLAFYTAKLGYYPPTSIDRRSTIFEPQIYRTLHDDFEALYELLVDESFTSGQSTPPLAQGGICAMQSVHSFDARYRYRSLEHPLPLLPEVGGGAAARHPRRTGWMGMAVAPLLLRDKLRPDQRLVAHAALIKATNARKRHVAANDLVRAYRRFEEDVVSHSRVDRGEKISLVDARKVRWILVYSIYQVLRNIVVAPAEVRDADDLDYHVSISTTDENLPPWKEGGAGSRRASYLGRSTSNSTFRWNASAPPTPGPASLSFSAGIKPDIDYFALTHKAGAATTKAKATAAAAATTAATAHGARPSTSGQGMPGRSLSLTKTFANGAFRGP